MARKTIWPTLAGAAALSIYELFPSTPLSGYEQMAAFIIIVHITWISWLLAQMSKGEMPFLYTRGFRWDVIWWHRVAVSVLPPLVAVGVAWGILLLGCRTVVQVGLGNTLYPLVGRREVWVPMKWLELYAIFLPVGLYAFARIHHEWPFAGLWLGIAVGVTALFAWNLPPWLFAWVSTAILIGTSFMIVLLLWAGQRLHREVEVAS